MKSIKSSDITDYMHCPKKYHFDRTKLDGWDMGILIVVNRNNKIGIKPVLSKINDGLIDEVGWLKGGLEELRSRLTKLEQLGLLQKEVTPYFGGDKSTWSVTDQAREEFEGLK